MRRTALLASVLLISACSGSGFWQYQRDTLTLPGANPNMPVSGSENFLLTRHGQTHVAANPSGPLLTEAGDIWPGPSQTVPTLKDLQKQEVAGTNGNSALAPLPPLPSLPGYEIAEPEPGPPPPGTSFPSGIVHIPGGRNPATIGGAQNVPPLPPALGGNIVVPNGNGTSTVISPNGTVTTIPTTPPPAPPPGTH